MILAAAPYLIFSLAYLRLPGLQYDEVLFANAALGDVDGTFIAWEVRILDHKVPVMLMPYIGALKAWLYAPVFRSFGSTPASVRVPVVMIGLGTVVFSYFLARRMLGERPAVIGALLLASDPTFIFANRLDWGPVSLSMVLKVASLYFLWRWLAESRTGFLALAAFLMGLGLYDKLAFAWFIAAVALSLPICFPQAVRRLLRPAALAAGLAAFAAGASPLIAYNLAVPWGSFQDRDMLTFDWRESLPYRKILFQSTFDGGAIYYFVNSVEIADDAPPASPRPEDAFGAAVRHLARLLPLNGSCTTAAVVLALLTLAAIGFAGRIEHAREILFTISLVVIIAAAICVTKRATGAHHAVMLYPFPHLLIGAAVAAAARQAEAGWAKKIPHAGGALLLACTLPLVSARITVDARYLDSFRVRGGAGAWSDAIYRLADYCRQNRDKTYLLMDWGFSTQLLVLSGNRIKKQEVFFQWDDLSDEDRLIRMLPLLSGPEVLLVSHVPPFETHPSYEFVKRAPARHGLETRPVKTFYQRDGRPIYVVQEVVREEIEDHAERGSFSYLREAEEWDGKSGGALDLKPAASRARALGSFWGRSAADFALYRFEAPRTLKNLHLYLRYAFEGERAQRYYLTVDGELADILTLPPTGGYGYGAGEWRIAHSRLGVLGPGLHELRIAPAGDSQIVNLDYFCLCEGELAPDFSLQNPAAGLRGPAGGSGALFLEVVGAEPHSGCPRPRLLDSQTPLH